MSVVSHDAPRMHEISDTIVRECFPSKTFTATIGI